MSRSSLILAVVAPALVALASCATVSGLADKEVVDCPGGCTDDDAGTRVTPDATTNDVTSTSDAPIDTGPPPCDPSKDDACLQLPAGGWTLVARTTAFFPAPCPAGFGGPADVGESPAAQFNTCTCDSCTVTTQASCAGQVVHEFGSAGTCSTMGSSSFYADPAPGQCQNDLFTGNRTTNTNNKFTLPSASGGACTGNAAVHPDRFNWSNKARICDATTRCSQGVCDARVSDPFAICVAQDGATQCPTGFPDRHVVASQGDADCSACSCSLSRAPCTGTMNHYTDANCTNGIVTHNANGTCIATALNGSFLSYKVIASSATTCSASGGSSASNPRPKDPRTVCCR